MHIVQHAKLQQLKERAEWRVTVLDTEAPRKEALYERREKARFSGIDVSAPMPHSEAISLMDEWRERLPGVVFQQHQVSRRRSTVWAVRGSETSKDDLPLEFIVDRNRRFAPRSDWLSPALLDRAEGLLADGLGGFSWRYTDEEEVFGREEGVAYYTVRASRSGERFRIEALPVKERLVRGLRSDPRSAHLFQLYQFYSLAHDDQDRARAVRSRIRAASAVGAKPGRYDIAVVPATQGQPAFKSKRWRVRVRADPWALEELRDELNASGEEELSVDSDVFQPGCNTETYDPLKLSSAFLSHLAFPAGMPLDPDRPLSEQSVIDSAFLDPVPDPPALYGDLSSSSPLLEPVRRGRVRPVDPDRDRHVLSSEDEVRRVWGALRSGNVLEELVCVLDFEVAGHGGFSESWPDNKEYQGVLVQAVMASQRWARLASAWDLGVESLDGAEVVGAGSETGVGLAVGRESLPLLYYYFPFEDIWISKFNPFSPKQLADRLAARRRQYSEEGGSFPEEVERAARLANERRRRERGELGVRLGDTIAKMPPTAVDLYHVVRNGAPLLPNLKLGTLVGFEKSQSHEDLEVLMERVLGVEGPLDPLSVEVLLREEGLRLDDRDALAELSRYTVADGRGPVVEAARWDPLLSLETLMTGLPRSQLSKKAPEVNFDRMRRREFFVRMLYYRDFHYHSFHQYERARESEVVVGEWMADRLRVEASAGRLSDAVVGKPRWLVDSFEAVVRDHPAVSVLYDSLDAFSDPLVRARAWRVLEGFVHKPFNVVLSQWEKRGFREGLELGTSVPLEEFYGLDALDTRYRPEWDEHLPVLTEELEELSRLEYIFTEAFGWETSDVPRTYCYTPDGDIATFTHGLWYYGDRLAHHIREYETVHAAHPNAVVARPPAEGFFAYGRGPAALLGERKAALATPERFLAIGTYIPPAEHGEPSMIELLRTYAQEGYTDRVRTLHHEIRKDPPPRQQANIDAFSTAASIDKPASQGSLLDPATEPDTRTPSQRRPRPDGQEEPEPRAEQADLFVT